MVIDKKYKTIVADPPWSYRNKRTGGSMLSGSASKYFTMSLDEICNLSIKTIADKDCMLFLWITVPLLPDGLKVLDAWGFKYKTCIVWRKIMSLGLGYWFRGQNEFCLFGIKGKIKAFRLQKPNFIQSKVRKHSQKPEEFWQLIEPVVIEPKIELFATERRVGWDTLGFDVDGQDIREVLKCNIQTIL